MAPVIVLVRPQLGQNIGKAARAMLNFGLTELRLVQPRDGWPNPEAGPAASGADVVLEQAQVFDSTRAAIADCSLVFASTVRRRDLVMPVVGPEQMADEIAASPKRSAILFGPERSGLETDDEIVAGSGNADIAPRDEAEIHIAGSGDVNLHSNPRKVETHIAGSGRIHNVGASNGI